MCWIGIVLGGKREFGESVNREVYLMKGGMKEGEG
jgi:hypothetical protein